MMSISMSDMVDELTEFFVERMDQKDLIQMAYEIVRNNVESMGAGEVKAQWLTYIKEKE